MPYHPNVVLFMVDQLSARWLEEPAAEAIPTPNIDELRSEGVTFSNTYADNPVCMPARATIATGLTCRGHGVLQNGYGLDPEVPTFMHHLQDAGWRTGVAGKVHLRPHYEDLHPDYTSYGFDEAHVTEDPRGGEWFDWVRSEHPDHEEAAMATMWDPLLPGFSDYGPEGEDLQDRIQSVRADFEWATEEHPDNGPWMHTLPFPEEVSQTNWITRHGLDFIRSAAGEEPFFEQISYVQPHGPFCPPAEYMDEVDIEAIPEPTPPEWHDDPHAPACFEAYGDGEIPENWRQQRQYYFADLVHLDRQLGRVLETLEAAGVRDETYVIFLSDHGETLFDHGFDGKNPHHYDATIRVPLTIAGPGLDAGTERTEFVQLVDLFPTILDLAGVPVPDPEVGRRMDVEDTPTQTAGRSLVSLCEGTEPTDWRDAAYVESYNTVHNTDPGEWARTLRTEEFRYTWYPNWDEQLFRNDVDPDEQENLAGDPAYEETRRRLRDQLLERIVRQDYPHTPRDRVAYGAH